METPAAMPAFFLFPLLSSSAKADDPVFQRRQQFSGEAAAYWMPAFAGMTKESVAPHARGAQRT
jgi:hypothetical protein